MSKPPTTKPPPRSPANKRVTNASRRSFPVWAVIIGAVVVAGVLAVLLAARGGDDNKVQTGPDENGNVESAAVTITGDPLPRFESTTDDAAAGETAPTITGSNFSGAPVTIPAADGNAKAIFFVAHWCPHCQREVPRLAKWLKTHPLPAGLDIDIVSTRVNESPANYPPSAWLDREGLGNLPIIADDPDSSAYRAYGAGGLPYIVYLDKDDKVVLRTVGEYGDDPEVYTDLFANLAAGKAVEDPRDTGS
jgi:thiol-disulfide isomerase/thioredoxin